MSRINYSKMSQTPPTEQEPTFNEEVIQPKTAMGVVVDCVRLNVRMEPNINSDVVCEVSRNSELLIDIDASTDEWFSVCTAAGSEGFCMKKFIEIQQ